MQLAELLAQIEELKAEIDKLRPLKPEVERRIMQKFRLDWNYHSNAIEGNTLTLGETRAFLMEGLTANGKPLKDHLDIKGHNELLDFLEQFIRQKERLTEAAIREMHKILLKEPYQVDAITSDGRIVKKTVHLGEYKQEQNCVRTATGDIYEYARPDEVAPKMAELLKWYEQREASQDDHPLVIAAIFHHKFLAIHPFDDGNGRMGRILMNLILMRHGFPPAIIKLQKRDPYVAALRKADTGEINGIVDFIAINVLDSERLYLRGAKGLNIDDEDDVDKALALLKQELSSIQAPIELSLEVQQAHFKSDLFPFLERVILKLRQFDELFSGAKVILDLNTQSKIGLPSSSHKSFSEDRLQKTQECFQKLAASNSALLGCTFNFHWDGFLKDGTNDFSVRVSFAVKYEARKFHFNSTSIGFSKVMTYGTWLTEEEASFAISRLSKFALQQIQAKRSKK